MAARCRRRPATYLSFSACSTKPNPGEAVGPDAQVISDALAALVREHELSSHLNPVPRSASNHYLATHLKLSCKRAGKRRTLGSLVAWKWLTEVPNTSRNFSLSNLIFRPP